MKPAHGSEGIRHEIDLLCSDNTSGSRAVYRKALKLLSLIISGESPGIRENLLYFTTRLESSFPEMQLISALTAKVRSEIEKGNQPADPGSGLSRIIDSSIAETRKRMSTIAETISGMIPSGSTVITLSRSETVLEALQTLHESGKVKAAIISESRPANEGKAMAEELASIGLGVYYTVDAALDWMCGKADFALVGADMVFPDLSAVNKIGTAALARSCRDRNIPFIVVCESSKLTERGRDGFVPTKRDGGEIYDPRNPGIEVVNFYFEITDSSLISAIVTENGILKKEGVKFRK